MDDESNPQEGNSTVEETKVVKGDEEGAAGNNPEPDAADVIDEPKESLSPSAEEVKESLGVVGVDEAGSCDSPKRTPSAVSKDKEKINIRLNPVGDAPILKQKLWAVPADREVGQIIEFIRKYLKLDKQQGLFFFVNQAFAPSPDQSLRELYECFGSDGKIVLHYSTTYAWG